jgi:hypothetical protein
MYNLLVLLTILNKTNKNNNIKNVIFAIIYLQRLYKNN